MSINPCGVSLWSIPYLDYVAEVRKKAFLSSQTKLNLFDVPNSDPIFDLTQANFQANHNVFLGCEGSYWRLRRAKLLRTLSSFLLLQQRGSAPNFSTTLLKLLYDFSLSHRWAKFCLPWPNSVRIRYSSLLNRSHGPNSSHGRRFL